MLRKLLNHLSHWGTLSCPNCGADLSQDDYFCPFCGDGDGIDQDRDW